MVVLMLSLLTINALSQDPHFSQFFNAPLYLNPSMVGNTDADVRIMTNFRQQWLGPASPYYTGKISVEHYLVQDGDGNNVLALGVNFMHDNTFSGILKSNYAGLSLAYHMFLDEDLNNKISIGFGAMYGKRALDVNRLVFASQFESGGFNTTLPSGETALSNMKSFVSLNSGASYSYSVEEFYFELGGAIFHLNKPIQTFLKDERQEIPLRYSLHSNIDFNIGDSKVLNFNGQFQRQVGIDYFMIGGTLGFILPDGPNSYSQNKSKIFYLGGWFRNKDAIIPYVGYTFNNINLGVSYDATISKLNRSTSQPNTFELSMSYRFSKSPESLKRGKCPTKRNF